MNYYQLYYFKELCSLARKQHRIWKNYLQDTCIWKLIYKWKTSKHNLHWRFTMFHWKYIFTRIWYSEKIILYITWMCRVRFHDPLNTLFCNSAKAIWCYQTRKFSFNEILTIWYFVESNYYLCSFSWNLTLFHV